MKHRILFVIENLFPLGPAQQLRGLAKSLADQGNEIHVAVVGQREFEPTQWTTAGIKVCFLNGDDKTPLHTIRDGFQVVRELRSLIFKLNPEIVHSWCGSAEFLTLLAAQDLPLLKPHERFRLLSTELYIQPEKRFTRQILENKMAAKVERMLVPHVSVKKHLVANGYREHRIHAVPSGVFEEDIQANRIGARNRLHEQLGLDASVYLAGTVAPLQHRTRLKDLIWATDLLTTIRDDFHFLIIGNGSQFRRLKRFTALAESARPNVHFLGHPQDPQSVVAGLDFYWHSHLRHPMSGNLLSAMANGIPTVSVYGEGTKEIVRPQETALGVNFGARDEFARWTKFLIEKPDSARQLAEQGRNFVRQHFDNQKMIDGYVGVYDLTS